MGLDNAQGLGRGGAKRLLFVLFGVLALLLLGAFSSQTARADLLGTVTDLIDQTEEVVETSTAPLVDDFVEIIPPVVEEVVEIVPPVVEEVVEIIPPVVEDVPVDVIGIIPPVVEFDDVGAIEPPIDAPFAPPTTSPSPIPNEVPTPGTAQGASSDQPSVFDLATLDISGPIHDPSSIYGGTVRGHSTRAAVSHHGDPPLTPRVPIAALLPGAVGGYGGYLLSNSAFSGGGFYEIGMNLFGFFAAFAALLALCVSGLIRDRSIRLGRSIFLRHEARPG